MIKNAITDIFEYTWPMFMIVMVMYFAMLLSVRKKLSDDIS